MNIVFTQTGWSEYTDWQLEDKKTVKKINKLIRSITRDGLLKGEGKPEFLKYLKVYSRKIDEKNRLVYTQKDENIVILSCKGHYDD